MRCSFHVSPGSTNISLDYAVVWCGVGTVHVEALEHLARGLGELDGSGTRVEARVVVDPLDPVDLARLVLVHVVLGLRQFSALCANSFFKDVFSRSRVVVVVVVVARSRVRNNAHKTQALVKSRETCITTCAVGSGDLSPSEIQIKSLSSS